MNPETRANWIVRLMLGVPMFGLGLWFYRDDAAGFLARAALMLSPSESRCRGD